VTPEVRLPNGGPLRFLVAAGSAVCLGAAAAHAQASSPVAITGVAVVDVVAGATRPGQTVLISGNRITAVGPASSVRVPAGARASRASGTCTRTR
jgi:hypothetical protein